jgi:hypothetical protein
MGIRRLITLQNELRTLDRSRFLSTRDKRRQRLERTHERRIKTAVYREERRLIRKQLRTQAAVKSEQAVAAESPPNRPVELNRPRCMMCGRAMRGRKRRFCGKKCRAAALKLPSPRRIKDECDKIISRWDAAEESRRSRRIGGPAKFRLAAQLIERYGRQLPANQSAAEAHDITFHGSSQNRSDTDYWNQTPSPQPPSATARRGS